MLAPGAAALRRRARFGSQMPAVTFPGRPPRGLASWARFSFEHNSGPQGAQRCRGHGGSQASTAHCPSARSPPQLSHCGGNCSGGEGLPARSIHIGNKSWAACAQARAGGRCPAFQSAEGRAWIPETFSWLHNHWLRAVGRRSQAGASLPPRSADMGHQDECPRGRSTRRKHAGMGRVSPAALPACPVPKAAH